MGKPCLKDASPEAKANLSTFTYMSHDKKNVDALLILVGHLLSFLYPINEAKYHHNIVCFFFK